MTISSVSNSYRYQQIYGVKNTYSPAGAVQTDATISGDSVTISSAAYQQLMNEKVAGQNILRTNALNDQSSFETTKYAYDLAHANLMDGQGGGGLIDISGSTPGGTVSYTSGEPVTEESKAYFAQQAAKYQDAAVKLYNSETAKGTTAGEIVNQLFDLQAQQSTRFRSMMMWT
jgi:hypothetical protein